MFPYESLDVYKKSFQYHGWVYKFLKDNSNVPGYLKSQLGRASLSIPLNIAEGSAMTGIRSKKNFLTIARGSVFECNSLVRILASANEISPNQEERVVKLLDEISRMLYAMIQNLSKKD